MLKKTNKLTTIEYKIIWGTIYFIITIALIVTSCFLFKKNYYSSIFVSGFSMQPTLNKNFSKTQRYDFGIVDTHKKRIDHIKRYDIVTTFYPWESSDYEMVNGEYVFGSVAKKDAVYKIKRVLALPGETLKIENNDIFINDVKLNLPFSRKIKYSSNFLSPTTLGENEYWVMGDNWDDSQDCYDFKRPIYNENITGVLVAIEGTCLIKNVNGIEICYDRKYHKTIYF